MIVWSTGQRPRLEINTICKYSQKKIWTHKNKRTRGKPQNIPIITSPAGKKNGKKAEKEWPLKRK